VKKILIIDDSNTIAKGLEIILRHSSFKNQIAGVEIANTGEEGILKAKQFKPNIIFLDIEMPGMNGFQTLVELKKMTNPQFAPAILMISTHNTQNDVIESIKNGAQDYLLKPFDEKSLHEKLKKFF
jgi:DNA-binding response OmpR family regulator